MKDFSELVRVELPLFVILIQLLPFMVRQIYMEEHGFDPGSCVGCSLKQEAVRSLNDALVKAGMGPVGKSKQIVEGILNGVLVDL